MKSLRILILSKYKRLSFFFWCDPNSSKKKKKKRKKKRRRKRKRGKTEGEGEEEEKKKVAYDLYKSHFEIVT